MKKTAEFIFEILKNEIFSKSLKSKFRICEKDFSRNRKQSFPTTILFMMNLLTKSLAIEIDGFVNFIRDKCIPAKTFTQSAFVQARKKIKPAVFKKLSQTIIDQVYTNNDESIKLWKDFRLLAVDGSHITLPITDELWAIKKSNTNHYSPSTLFCIIGC